MITGRVDESGRALVPITVIAGDGRRVELEVWIDTGFTGELVLSEPQVANLPASQSGTVSAELGDGSSVILNTYSCRIEWFGQELMIEVVSNKGSFPLLGVGLLNGHELMIDYEAKTASVY